MPRSLWFGRAAWRALEATDFSQGAFATDHGPFMGVFARTSSDRGATWSAPVRVSQGGKQADRAALKWSLKWLVWLQDALITWGMLV